MLDSSKYVTAWSETAIPCSVFRVSRIVMEKLHRRKGTVDLLMKTFFTSKNNYMLSCHHLKQGVDIMSIAGIYSDLRNRIARQHGLGRQEDVVTHRLQTGAAKWAGLVGEV